MASQEVLSALEILHNELNKIAPAIKLVEKAQELTQVVSRIPQKHLDLLNAVKEDDAKHKASLTQLFTSQMESLTEEHHALQRVTNDIQNQIKDEQAALNGLKERIQAFYERVEKINFPERLDKIDANIAGIMAATQAVQSRLDTIERNITERLRDMQESQKESRNSLQMGLEVVQKVGKQQQVLTYITIGLIVLGIVVTFLLKK